MQLQKEIDALKQAIQETPEYLEYIKQQTDLNLNPELKLRVDKFRADNFYIQTEVSQEHKLHEFDRIAQESDSLHEIIEVNAYLEAEIALCKLLQDISLELLGDIDLSVPEIPGQQ
ncbi:MAG: YlbF family regulator [Lachnospiraceae bacterium]